LVLLPAAVAFSQENAELIGVVSDSTGAVISHASVTLTDSATGVVHKTLTDSAGIYIVSNLNNSRYDLTVVAPGFKTFEKRDIVLNVAATVKEDVEMVVGSVAQSVTVQANALQVQSETSEINDLMTGKQISLLATNGRNITELATLGMGVTNNLPDVNGVFSESASTDLRHESKSSPVPICIEFAIQACIHPISRVEIPVAAEESC